MNNLVSYSKKFFKRNSSTILTCVGSVGVIATAVLTAKATPKALYLIEEAKTKKGEELTKFEIVKSASIAYVPAILMGASTIACIFGANLLNKKQQAALMSAYAFIDNSYKDYRKKVSELYGEESQAQIRESLAKDKYKEQDIQTEDDNKILFLDSYSMQYFEATMEDVISVEYKLNRQLATLSYATLNDFYKLLGIPTVEEGDILGWSSGQLYEMCWTSWIDFEHEKFELEDGLQCVAIHMPYEPTIDFEEY